jgi:hypothetical protein
MQSPIAAMFISCARTTPPPRGNRTDARQRLQAAAHERCEGIKRTHRAARVELDRLRP